MILPVGATMQLEVIEERRNQVYPQLQENVWRGTLPDGGQFARVIVMTDDLYRHICVRLAHLQMVAEEIARDPIHLGTASSEMSGPPGNERG